MAISKITTKGIADVPDSIKLAWQLYRQALRDITSNYTDIRDVVWPTKPA